jgi:hydrogenase maturation factor
VVGPGVGEDAAAIEFDSRLLIAKSDPITFATDQIGWYAVQVNANDIACSGGTPRWFLATLLVPEGYSEGQAEEIFDQVVAACDTLDVTLVGGHSEVTFGIDRPIVAGTMLGEAYPNRLVRTGGAQEGDSIVITKGIAIEGTALLARERRDALLALGVAADLVERASTFITTPGISVVHEAKVACAAVPVHSLHDPTEGGLVTGLREVGLASGLGVGIEEGGIPILPECREICQALGLDPMGLLASGSLLITLAAGDVPALLSALKREGIVGWEIGQMLATEEGFQMIGYLGETPLPDFPRDELARFFDEVA